MDTQGVRWNTGGIGLTNDYTFFYGNGNGNAK